MTWASHIIVGASISKVFGLNYVLTTFGAILPDLAEMVTQKGTFLSSWTTGPKHRGITHSVSLWLIALVLLWPTILRDCIIGVVFAHLLLDSLTIMGVPIFDENSKRITLFGGKLRTASAGEFAVSGIIAIVVFFVLGHFSLSTEGRNWKELFLQGLIDKKEFYENRFHFF